MAPAVGSAVGAKMKQVMIVAALAIASIAASTGAIAQAVSQNVNISVFVPKFCTVGGIIKPFFFGLIIGSIACFKGLSTTGGTVGVGRSTTNAVVASSVWVIIFDFFLSKALQTILDLGRV